MKNGIIFKGVTHVLTSSTKRRDLQEKGELCDRCSLYKVCLESKGRICEALSDWEKKDLQSKGGIFFKIKRD